jgi:hypothetical protein
MRSVMAGVTYLRRHHLAALALFVALGGTSYAAISGIPDSGGAFHGCVDTRTGTLRVVQRTGLCRAQRTVKRGGKRVRVPGEFAVSWNQRGQSGPAGAQGLTGQVGPAGQAGPPGQTGAPGRSASSVLQPEETVHGAWAVTGEAAASTQVTGITLPIAAPQPIDSKHVVVTGNDSVTGDGCVGTAAAPLSAPGFVCIYFATATGTTASFGVSARSDAADPMATGDGSPYGFVIDVSGSTSFFADGTWVYTAP